MCTLLENLLTFLFRLVIYKILAVARWYKATDASVAFKFLVKVADLEYSHTLKLRVHNIVGGDLTSSA